MLTRNDITAFTTSYGYKLQAKKHGKVIATRGYRGHDIRSQVNHFLTLLNGENPPMVTKDEIAVFPTSQGYELQYLDDNSDLIKCHYIGYSLNDCMEVFLNFLNS